MAPSAEHHNSPLPTKTGTDNGAAANGTKSENERWATADDAGDAAFDFRSDVVTRPTVAMLTAIQNATLNDDVFEEDVTTNNLQDYIASLTGHEAGLFVASGTMGNQISIRTHLMQPPHSILVDRTSHVMEWEAGTIASLSGALAIAVRPANGHHLTLTDVKTHAILTDDVHACPTRLISLENTLGGTILPLADCEEISAWARAQDPPLRLHLDGARLWQAVAAGAGSLRAYCACFDSVSLCFSKGLGAPVGSMIVGGHAFIRKARHLRKGLGGGLRQLGVLTAPARVAVDETFLGGRLAATHELAKTVARMWESKGGLLLKPCETNMIWFDLEAAGVATDRFVQLGLDHGVKLHSGRLVVHYQISPEGLRRLDRVMAAALGLPGPKKDHVLDDKTTVANGAGPEKVAETMAPSME